MKKIFVFALIAIMGTACSHIDEDERLIYVKPADVARAVLIEDFTGQRCINCPAATDVIHQLQEAYGDDKVIAVAPPEPKPTEPKPTEPKPTENDEDEEP